MSKQALKRILENIKKHARGKNARVLDLANCGMTEVPNEIGECVWIEEIFLSKNKGLLTLSPLLNLTALKKLHCGLTQVIDLSPLTNLTVLQEIRCSFTQITDLSPIAKLTSLEILSCHNTLVTDLSPLANLTALNMIHCEFTQVVDLSPLANLRALKMLFCHNTQVSDLSPLSNLTALQTLSCHNTQVSDLSPLSNLTALQTLFCHNTQVSDLSPLSNLTALQTLSCHNTEVSDLSPLSKLVDLKKLDCFYAEVSDLSPLLPLIQKGIPVRWERVDKGICIEGCPLVHPPLEIVKQGNASILAYFAELEKTGEEKSLEAKVVLVGESMAGKTSLRTRLIKGEIASLPPKDERTKGLEVEVEPYYVDLSNGERIRLNLFDFAGQTHYKPLHQFFYSHRSLYVLVTKNGDDSNDFDYWFDTAQLFGGGSPVLVVNNLFGDVPSAFSRSRYERFEHIIKDSLDTNFLTCTGFHAVKKRIGQLAEDLPHVHLSIPKSWANVRRELEARRKSNLIPLEDYFQICARPENGGMDKKRALYCSAYLHDIGICLHYPKQEFPALHRYVIVRNEWATEAVYRVMEDPKVNRMHGHFDTADLDRIWQARQEDIEQSEQGKGFGYEDYLPELLELMRQFKLCYPLKDLRSYVAPSLLPVKQEKDIRWQPDQDLQFEMEYDFMPPALFSRFVVSRYEDIGGENRDQVWKDEVFFQWENARASVNQPSRAGKKAIVFKVQGKDLESRKLLLTSLLRDLTALHKETPGIKVEERIPCICDACKESDAPTFYRYSQLKTRKENQKKTIECDKPPFCEVNIDELLGNIFSTRENVLMAASPEKIMLSLIKEGRLEEALVQMDEVGYSDVDLLLGQFRTAKKANLQGNDPAIFMKEENRIRVVAKEMLEKRQK